MAITRRCPRCGQGKLFTRWFKLAERCPRCGLLFEREEGAFLGSMSLNYAVTGVGIIALLVIWGVGIGFDDGYIIPMVVSLGIIAVIPLLFYPFSKTIWAAIDLLLHRMDADDIREAWRDDRTDAPPPGR